MARPSTRGLEYVYLAKDFFFDRKVKRLKRKCGDDAPYVYLALLCLITPEGYYVKYDNDTVYDLADMTGFEEDKVAKILDTCGEVGLLDNDLMEREHILTSHGIQKYYAATCAQLKRKNSVEEFSLIDEQIEGVPSGETPKNEENQGNFGVSSEETHKIEGKCKKIEVSSGEIPTNIKKRNIGEYIEENNREDYYSSLEENLSEEQKEQERFVSFFTFEQNFVNPNYEYRRMVAYNNNPASKKKWSQMTEAERQACVFLWHPEKESVGEHKARYSLEFLEAWRLVYQEMLKRAPYDVRLAALSDNIKWQHNKGQCELTCPEILYRWIEVPRAPDAEANLKYVKPILWPLMQKYHCDELHYTIVKQ